jgi:hypothetical protein
MNDFNDPNKTMQRILDKHKLNFFGTRRFIGAGNLVSNNEGYKINNERIASGEKTVAAKLSGYKRYNQERSNNRYNNDNRYNPKKI